MKGLVGGRLLVGGLGLGTPEPPLNPALYGLSNGMIANDLE